jgi:gliding motility-associated-like protein
MKKNLFFIVIVAALFQNGCLLAQAPVIDWQKCLGGFENNIGDIATCARQTSDGGYIVAGYAYSNDGDITAPHGNADYWIVKLDAIGAVVWQKSLGGSSGEYAYDIIQTSDGGYIVAGWTGSNDGDVSGNHGWVDYWVVKLSSVGTIQWQKCYGGTSSDQGRSIQQTTDGGYIVAGFSYSNDGDVSGNHYPDQADYWVIKIDNNGSLQWQKCYGSSRYDAAFKILQTGDGGYIVAGITDTENTNDGDVSGNHTGRDYWVVKLSNTGNIQWQKCLGGNDIDMLHSIDLCPDGGFIVVGSSNSESGDVSGNHPNPNNNSATDYWVVKLNATGALQWQKCLGGTDIDIAFAVKSTPDGGYIVAGSSTSSDGDVTAVHNPRDEWVVKLRNNGTIEWQKCYGGSDQDEPYSVENTSDGGFIMAGFTNSGLNDGDVTNPHFSNDYWVVKLLAAPCIPVISIQPSANNICAGSTVIFTATTSYGGTNPFYQWKVNGVNAGTNSNTFTTSSLSNNDSIVCILTSSAACASQNPIALSDTVVMIVSNNQQPSITIGTNTPVICKGEMVTVNAAISNAGTNPSYQWKLNGSNSGGNSPVYSSIMFNDGDQLNCTLTANATGCINNIVTSNMLTFTVNSLPVISLTPTDTIVMTGSKIKINTTVSGSMSSFEWLPANMLQDPSILSPVTIPVTGNTFYKLKVVNSNGCITEKIVQIRVFMPLFMPSAFTPNRDGLNDVFRIPPDVALQLKEFSVFTRWGDKIFSTNDITKGWDGTIKNIPADSGVFVYIVTGVSGGKDIFLKNTFVLIR